MTVVSEVDGAAPSDVLLQAPDADVTSSVLHTPGAGTGCNVFGTMTSGGHNWSDLA